MRGQEMIEVRKMPMRRAPLTRYNTRNTVKMLSDKKIASAPHHACRLQGTHPPVKIPSQVVGERITRVSQKFARPGINQGIFKRK